MYNITHPAPEHKVEKLPAYILGKTPVDFDPERFPIIATHFFGIDPASINGASAALVADPPFHRLLEERWG